MGNLFVRFVNNVPYILLFEYQPDNELKSGPGLLSGEDGVFTIYQKPNEGDANEASQVSE